MSSLYLMITVAERARLPAFIALYRMNGLPVNFIALGHGTARGELLNLLGLDSVERAVCFNVVTMETWRAVKRGLEHTIRIDVPGTGVAFLIPMSSIGGRRELAFLTEQQTYERGEESVMQGTNRELLVVISNRGFQDLVMDAARDAGAAGGTVISARGTGMERAEKFLGISLASEKDITLIVTRTIRKNDIMRSIMRKAGMESQAKSIVFSLPVSSTAGLRLLDEEEDGGADAADGTGASGNEDSAAEGSEKDSGK